VEGECGSSRLQKPDHKTARPVLPVIKPPVFGIVKKADYYG